LDHQWTKTLRFAASPPGPLDSGVILESKDLARLDSAGLGC
jgi:hypothetical protein